MNILAFLALIRDLVVAGKNLAVRVGKLQLKKKVEVAKEKAEVEGDQREMEKAVSGNGGNPTVHKYAGLRIQKAKKRR